MKRIAAVMLVVAALCLPAGRALPRPLLHADRGSNSGSPLEYAVDGYAPWSPSEYDGAVFTDDAPDLTELPSVHTAYMVPADLPDRFAQFAAMFQADARQASGLLRELYGRGIRFDERAGAGSRTYLDITFIRSRQPAAFMSTPSYQFQLVQSELRRVGLTDPDKKYAVWLDAPSWACGMGQFFQDDRRSASNRNEASTIAVVYRNFARSASGGRGDPNGGGFCRGAILMHELGHTFGALQMEAPNDLEPLPSSPFGAHCRDSAEDVMCYRPPAIEDTGGPAFDWRNDDYWDPAANPALGTDMKLGWWTVNLSRFVCPATGCDHPNPDPGY